MEQEKLKPRDIKKRAYNLSLRVVIFSNNFAKCQLGTVIILKQLIRASTSIAANLIEAKAASSTKDFINFNYYSLKSANETLYWLYLLRDSQDNDTLEILTLIKETDEITRILASCIIKMKK